MRKINIGAGSNWKEKGWEILDNGTGSFKETWKHKGKVWENNLKKNAYDIVLTSHMLEHIPHFRLEKTISEFNRILKIGGTLRILVPSLKKAVDAYQKGDKSFFSSSSHYSDHMGIGASFVRVLISPGQQTIAISRELDEILGGYAHLNCFDFEMLSTVLKKWGFGDIVESEPGKSKLKSLKKIQYLRCDGNEYDMKDDFVLSKSFLKSGKEWSYGGFDKSSSRQLIVEAKKVKHVCYSLSKEYEFHKGYRFNDPLMKIKLFIFKYISYCIDIMYKSFKFFKK